MCFEEGAKTVRTIVCNVCGEKRDFVEVYTDRPANLRVVRCLGCGLVFVNPTFTPREHLEYYNTLHWNEFATDAYGNYADIPAERIARWQKRARANIDYLATFSEKIKACAPLHVLEAGCGYAAHLEEVRRRCPEARLAAVEPNRRMYDLIRKRLPDVQILGKTLESLSGVRMLFDGIIAVDVIERTVDPTYACRRIHAMLANDGLCLIITHNSAGRQGHVYDLSRLYYFTEGTLHSLLTRCRLDIVRLDIRGAYGLAGDERICAIVKKK